MRLQGLKILLATSRVCITGNSKIIPHSGIHSSIFRRLDYRFPSIMDVHKWREIIPYALQKLCYIESSTLNNWKLSILRSLTTTFHFLLLHRLFYLLNVNFHFGTCSTVSQGSMQLLALLGPT